MGVKFNPFTANFDLVNAPQDLSGYVTFTENEHIVVDSVTQKQPFTLSYDGDDNVSEIDYADGVTKSFAYDIDGRLSTLTVTFANLEIIKTFNYDVDDNLIEVQVQENIL
jgi:YD repeat-containing protein